MSTGAVGRSQTEFKHHQRQAPLQRFVVGETRLARDAYLRVGGAGLVYHVPWYLDRARRLVTQLAVVAIWRECDRPHTHTQTPFGCSFPSA